MIKCLPGAKAKFKSNIFQCTAREEQRRAAQSGEIHWIQVLFTQTFYQQSVDICRITKMYLDTMNKEGWFTNRGQVGNCLGAPEAPALRHVI